MSYWFDTDSPLRQVIVQFRHKGYHLLREAQKNNWPFTELEFRFGKLYTLSRTGNWRVRKQQS